MKNTVAIIGRPNTGKSTLFNKIINKRESITSDEIGTTRDIIPRITSWRGVEFKIFDTGGINTKTKTSLEKNIQLQTDFAIKNSNVILFLVNTKEGLKAEDIQIANNLKKSKKNILLVASKADNNLLREETVTFYKLGLNKPIPVSAIKGAGVGDLLDEIISYLNNNSKEEIDNININVSILGKPNVGKSSLFNALSKDNKVIVSEEEGTTRDSINTTLKYQDYNIILIDTAGLRRKSKIKSNIDKLSSYKSLEKIKDSEICLFLIDASSALSRQDARIVSRILEKNKSLIIVANKWDLVRNIDKSKNKLDIKKYKEYLKYYFSFADFAPIIFISAKKKENISTLLKTIVEVSEYRNKIIEEKELDRFFVYINSKFFNNNDPKNLNNNIAQSKINPRQFILYTKSKNKLPSAYLNYIEKNIRKKYIFLGTPINITIKKY